MKTCSIHQFFFLCFPFPYKYCLTQLSYNQWMLQWWMTLDRFLSDIQGSQLRSIPRNLSEQHSHLLKQNTRPECVQCYILNTASKTLTETNQLVAIYCGAAVNCHILKYEGEHAGLVRILSSRIQILCLINVIIRINKYCLTQLSCNQWMTIQGSQLRSNPRNLVYEHHSHLLQWNTRPECVIVAFPMLHIKHGQ